MWNTWKCWGQTRKKKQGFSCHINERTNVNESYDPVIHGCRMIFPPQIPNQHFSTSITILKLLGNLWCWWSKDVHSVSWQQYKIFLKDSTEKLTLKFLPQTSIYQVLPRHQVLAEHKTRARECNLCSLFTGQLKQQDIYLSEEAYK